MKKKRCSNSIIRIAFVGISVLSQIGWILLLVLKLNNYSTWISLLTSVLSAIVVLKLYSKHSNAALKMPWIMLIMALPVMGLSLYFLFEVFGDPGSTGKRLTAIRRDLGQHLPHDSGILTRVEQKNRSAANAMRYLQNNTGSPVWENTQVVYHSDPKLAYEALKQKLESAERFIFMEYFIIEDAQAFSGIREILSRKASQGVEVRLLYDDVGSVGYVNWKFARQLNAQGIQCRVFNPALPVLNLFMNHRDHRKITVIDGKIGFTGGYNLANEYFGLCHPYGKWKDTGIMLEGEAVRSLTATFLELWHITTREREDYASYLDVTHTVPGNGFVQPFGDAPQGSERTAENVYLNLTARAEKRLWFMTPYLIISDEMNRALSLAAKRGVDVRIITPGVPDKKTVYQLTRSYYSGLTSQGVRIFEYSPGFCHAKQCLCDGDMASIGTSNLDYRSLYLHFENNVLMYDCPAVADMERDFRETFSQCNDVTEHYRSGRGAILRIWQCLLRLFAPLL